MTIIRNGTKMKLTAEELRLSYEEYQKECMCEDVKSFAEENDITLPEGGGALKSIVKKADDLLMKNDTYNEIYWDAIETAINEQKKER